MLAIIMMMFLSLSLIFYYTSEHEAESRIVTQANVAADYLEGASRDEALGIMNEQFAGVYRYTLIAEDGEVLYDSEVTDESLLDNHGARPEVLSAKEAGSSVASRYSETLNADMLYAAVQLDDGSFVRLSESRESLLSYMGELAVPMAVFLALACCLVFVVSRALTMRIMKPIDALDFSDPLENEIYEEMDPLLVRIDEQQRQLKIQNKELARAESLRRDFSANVSHEMKTPLQVIAGYAELMKNGMVPPEDTAKFAGLIYEESQAMRALINDVLTLSRLDETAFDGDTASLVDVLEVADRVKMRLQVLAQERGVTVSVSGENASVIGSPTLVEEMVYNLVENGIRYNHEGGSVAFHVSVEDVSDPFLRLDHNVTRRFASGQAPRYDASASQRQVVIRVTDTGPGIPPEKREKIFERFYRMEKSRSKETGGTGLGLAIVKHAVMYHNGRIDVNGEVGKGTTFTVRILSA